MVACACMPCAGLTTCRFRPAFPAQFDQGDVEHQAAAGVGWSAAAGFS
jgi:hypothetical protein